MGNYLVCGASIRVSTSSLSGKPCSVARLVHTDGTIEDITSPVTVAELMLDHPHHFVCHVNVDGDHESSDPAKNRRNFDHDSPLPADTHLESGEVYYLRSKVGFNSKSPLRALQRCSSDISINRPKNSLLEAFRLKQKGSITQVTVSAEIVSQIIRSELQQQERQSRQEQERDDAKKFSSAAAPGTEDDGNPELQMALQMRLVSRSVSWRPKLATIQESSI